ncbi:DUF2000 domain-containing protein [Herbiconiux sp. P18]|uniref:DUF2000 domain-containing protein n=1 Tax=Herbiconiux liangxiaofengii TaxID=3342795 RepID=UPI0035B725C2
MHATPAYRPEEILTHESTRSARLKWVVVVDSALEAGRLTNAVACVAAATGEAVRGLQGPAGADASGFEHPGLAWAGCTLLGASAEQLAAVRARAVTAADAATDPDEALWIADMPLAAQTTRVYDDYLAELSRTEPGALQSLALSIVGPRATVDRLVKKLKLL